MGTGADVNDGGVIDLDRRLTCFTGDGRLATGERARGDLERERDVDLLLELDE